MSEKLSTDELIWNIEYWQGKKNDPYNILTFEQSKEQILRLIEERADLLIVDLDPRAGQGKLLIDIKPSEEFIEEKAREFVNGFLQKGRRLGDINHTEYFIRNLFKEAKEEKNARKR